MSRIIFGACLILSAIILIAVIGGNWDVSVSIPDEVSVGYTLWQKHGCENCHTLFGQGGDYAPDLTHIYTLRGENYIREFMVDPSAYHPEQRLMPRFTMIQTDIDNLIAMFSWTANEASRVTANWPPNPIQVSGTGGLNLSIQVYSSGYGVINEGRVIYGQLCASCHTIEPNIILVGPSLWNVSGRAVTTFPDIAPEEYIRNSILHPSDYLVEGFQDVMQKNFAEVLTSEQIDTLVDFIMSLKDS
jgi:nitric oxide reductase subunit C